VGFNLFIPESVYGFQVFSQLARLSPCTLGRAVFDGAFPRSIGRLVPRHEFILLVPIRNIVDFEKVLPVHLRALEYGGGRTV
jgi:hypothetical protein